MSEIFYLVSSKNLCTTLGVMYFFSSILSFEKTLMVNLV